MNRLEMFLEQIAASLEVEAAEPSSGTRAFIVELGVDLPIESRFVRSELWASTPRGRLRTGFEPPLGRVHARFVREEAT